MIVAAFNILTLLLQNATKGHNYVINGKKSIRMGNVGEIGGGKGGVDNRKRRIMSRENGEIFKGNCCIML